MSCEEKGFYIGNLWGLGIGDWGLGIGPNPQSPIPNPQFPIPNPQSPYKYINIYFIFLYYNFLNNFLRHKIYNLMGGKVNKPTSNNSPIVSKSVSKNNSSTSFGKSPKSTLP